MTSGKRAAYRTLSEMPDEDWGVPDVCLQKTAEVCGFSYDSGRASASCVFCATFSGDVHHGDEELPSGDGPAEGDDGRQS